MTVPFYVINVCKYVDMEKKSIRNNKKYEKQSISTSKNTNLKTFYKTYYKLNEKYYV